MREQVAVLPPSNDKRKSSFNPSKRDESPLVDFCEDTRKWPVLENGTEEKSKGFTLDSDKDLRESADVQSVVAEKMMKENGRNSEDDANEFLRPEAERERQDKSLNCTAPLLQWGQRKRSRCSRVDNQNLKPCNLPDDSAVLFSKPCNLPDDSAVLFSKPPRVQADNAPVHANSPTSKSPLKTKNGVAAKKGHIYTARVTIQAHAFQEEKRKQVKHVKNGLPGGRQERKGSPVVGSKRGCPVSVPKKELQKKACTMPELRSLSLDTFVQPNVSVEDCSSKAELVWPKFVIGLSRKEKEEDFLILKGTKLPQRPRRRPKAVEKVLLYCSPGSWLVDISHSRYDVREKKRAKKKPRGLRGMESFDSDSE